MQRLLLVFVAGFTSWIAAVYLWVAAIDRTVVDPMPRIN